MQHRLCLLVAIALLNSHGSAVDPLPYPLESHLNEMGIYLMQGWAREHEGNVAFSGLSIGSGVAALMHGAKGATAAHLMEVLYCHVPRFVPIDQKTVESDFRTILSREVRGHVSPPSNKLLIVEDEAVTPPLLEYKEDVARLFDTTLMHLHFLNVSNDVVHEWVVHQSADLADALLEQETGDRIILLNSFSLSGRLAQPFDAADTTTATFFDQGTEGKEVEFLNGNMCLPNQEFVVVGHKFRALELPFVDNNSLVILLPEEKDALAQIWSSPELEDELSQIISKDMNASMPVSQVHVSLPYFTIGGTVNLKKTLQVDDLASLNLTLAFGSEADFSGINGKTNLHLSQVIHKLHVVLQETGDGAADGETACATTGTAVIADHPFLYLIRDRKTGVVLVIGRLDNVGGHIDHRNLPM